MPRTIGTFMLAIAACWPAVIARADGVDPAVRDAERTRVATIAKLAPTVVAVFQRSAPPAGPAC